MNSRGHLARVARALGELNERVVFVGGATVDMFITDKAAGPARFTEDVDVIVRVGSRVEFYEQIEAALGKRGFKPDMREGAPICRWVHGDVTLDVMPTDDSILGFSNRWYEEGIAHARVLDLGDAVFIRVLTAPHFIATKLEAFKGRGKMDYLGSADIEDVIRVVDGRPELAVELAGCGEELLVYMQEEIGKLLRDDDFLEALPGHLRGDAASQARADLVLERLRTMGDHQCVDGGEHARLLVAALEHGCLEDMQNVRDVEAVSNPKTSDLGGARAKRRKRRLAEDVSGCRRQSFPLPIWSARSR